MHLSRAIVASLILASWTLAISPPLAAQEAPLPASTPTITGTGIVGTVQTERGPVTSATVKITGPVTKTFTTAPDGVFRFSGIPPGAYRVSATAPGYEPAEPTSVTLVANVPQALTISLAVATLNSLRTIASTTTAGRGTVSINTSGAAQSTLNSQDYLARGDAQVQDLLEELPGVELTRASSGGAPGANTDVALRGASTYETQTLIDGHPVTGGSQGTFLVQFLNPLVLGTIEVDKGPGVFGNTIQNAVGGTVNFRTPNISTVPTGRLTAGYDSYDASTYSARFSDTIGKIGFLADYGFNGTPGYFTGNILQVSGGANTAGQPPAMGYVNGSIPASETLQNRSEVFKLAFNFSPTTTLTLGSIGEQSYVDYTATLATVEPFTIAPNGPGGYNNPAYNGLIGKTVLASGDDDDLFLGNFELDNEPIFTADLRTTFGPGSFLGRFYTGSITREINDPEEASQISGCTNTGTAAVPSVSCTTLGSGYYQSEVDRLHGADAEYSLPFARGGKDLAIVSYDQHADRSLACSGTSPVFNDASCTVNNLLLQSRTFSIRAFADIAPKLRVGFANYFSDTTFVGSRYDPRATLVWTPHPSTAIRFAVGTSYVAPSSGFVAPVAGSNKAVVAGVLDVSDALKPETSAGFDLGGDFGIHGDSKFTIDAYNTALTNRFSTITVRPAVAESPFGYYNGTPFNSIKEVYNSSDANEEGLEFGYVRAPRFGVGANVELDLSRAYNYNTVIPQFSSVATTTGAQTGTIGGDGTELPGYQIPGFPYTHGRAQVSYTLRDTTRFAFGTTVYGANNSFGEPGFSLFDFNTNVALQHGLRVNGSVTNIFNHDDGRNLGEYGYGYLPPGETVPYSLFFAPPRRVTLQLVYPLGDR